MLDAAEHSPSCLLSRHSSDCRLASPSAEMHPWPSLQAGSEGEAGPSRRVSQRPRRRRRAELEGDSDAEQEAAEGRQRKRPRHGAGWRELANYAWLAVCEQTPGVYVPQVGGVGWGGVADHLRRGRVLCSAGRCTAVPSCWR